jgi:hypothetical protein
LLSFLREPRETAAVEASPQTSEIQVTSAHAEPHLGSIHRLTRIRPTMRSPSA